MSVYPTSRPKPKITVPKPAAKPVSLRKLAVIEESTIAGMAMNKAV